MSNFSQGQGNQGITCAAYKLYAAQVIPQIALTLRKIAHFCIGNLICAQYRFMDGY